MKHVFITRLVSGLILLALGFGGFMVGGVQAIDCCSTDYCQQNVCGTDPNCTATCYGAGNPCPENWGQCQWTVNNACTNWCAWGACTLQYDGSYMRSRQCCDGVHTQDLEIEYCPGGNTPTPGGGGSRLPDVYAIFQVLEDTNNDNVGDKLVYSTGGPVCSAVSTMFQAQPFSVFRKHLTNVCDTQIGAGTKNYHSDCSIGPNIGAEASFKFDNSTLCCTYQSSSGETRQDCASQDREYWLDALKDASGNYYVSSLGTGMRDQFEIVGYSSNCSHKWGAMICEDYTAAKGMYDCGQDKCVKDQVYVRRKLTNSCEVYVNNSKKPGPITVGSTVSISLRGNANKAGSQIVRAFIGVAPDANTLAPAYTLVASCTSVDGQLCQSTPVNYFVDTAGLYRLHCDVPNTTSGKCTGKYSCPFESSGAEPPYGGSPQDCGAWTSCHPNNDNATFHVVAVSL